MPEGQEPKISPEIVTPARNDLPDGRQRLIKIFPLKNVQPAELKEKLRAVLSDKGTIDVTGNQLMVNDYTDNIRLVGELIDQLDVTSPSDIVIEFYSLKYSEAEELGSLLTLILNSQPTTPTPPSSSRSSSSSSVSRDPSGNITRFVGGVPSPEPPSQPPQPPPGGPQPPGGAAPPGTQPVRIWPDKVSNRLIVAAQKSKLPEVKRLIDLLDTEKPQDVSIRVIQLKNVSADDLVKDIGPLYQKMSGKSVKDVIEVAANSRANSLIVLSSESNFKAIEKLVSSLDTEEAQEKAMRAFPLKNADAEEVAKQMQDLNQDQDNQSRYPYYIFSSSFGSGRSSKKATFVADRRRNTVIVQAPPTAMDGIEKLIAALDEPVNDESLAPKIFRLKFVSAVDIEEVLNELFLKKQQQRLYWDPYNPFGQQDGGDRQGGRLYGKIRITSEPYANAIIVTSNSRENLAAVEDILKELDAPSQAGESTLRVGLRFAKASTVANNINILFARNGSPPLRQVAQQPANLAFPEQLCPRTGIEGGRLFSLARRATGQPPKSRWTEYQSAGQRPGGPRARRGGPAQQLAAGLGQCALLPPGP